MLAKLSELLTGVASGRQEIIGDQSSLFCGQFEDQVSQNPRNPNKLAEQIGKIPKTQRIGRTIRQNPATQQFGITIR
jgi:hypothetical protein